MVKDEYSYVYDFGSTTRLTGKVFAETEGAPGEGVRILARNNLPTFECDEFGKAASDFCQDCEAFYCQNCLLDEEHECGDEMSMPVVNSTRMVVCGFTGSYLKDEFEDLLTRHS